jgi:hypothetical protein
LVEERLERRLALAEEQARVKETQTTTMMQTILHQLQNNQDQVKASQDQVMLTIVKR